MDQQIYALAETIWDYPEKVWKAFEALVRAGYEKYLIRN
jgi:hypothetical protein